MTEEQKEETMKKDTHKATDVAADGAALAAAFSLVLAEARRVSQDVEREVEEIVAMGRERPLTLEEAGRVITKALATVRDRAVTAGRHDVVASIPEDLTAFVHTLVNSRQSGDGVPDSAASREKDHTLHLRSWNGIDPGPVRPSPRFYGREVHMNCGFVRTRDIRLWDENERLEIHRRQFVEAYGREPTPDELLAIMRSKMVLPGTDSRDEFEIVKLARSIAANGVQRPPIIGIDGTLLDGNRRLAACYHILDNDEFTAEEKQRVEYVFVWQLTAHTTDEDRHAVVVAMNFEEDLKKSWPEYVKARKVYEEWQARLGLEFVPPNAQRQAKMKRALSEQFALGPDTNVVNRYLRMVEWATDFESFHVIDKERDEFEVKHRASRYFQYFDELSKGSSPGGVAHTLNQDDAFRHLVFDLLFSGKFKNWREIRDLNKVAFNDDARKALEQARETNNIEDAQDLVRDATDAARLANAQKRQTGANTRIEVFVEWLEQLPVKAFRDTIEPRNLERLSKALKLVEHYTISEGEEEQEDS